MERFCCRLKILLFGPPIRSHLCITSTSLRFCTDSFLKAGKKSKGLKLARELFAATEAGSPSRPLFARSLYSILLKIHEESEVGSDKAFEESTCDSPSAGFLHGTNKDLRVPHQIRDIYSVQEEAFLLLVIRKHLLRQYGRKIQVAVVPQWGTAGMATLPLLMGLDPEDEVAPSDRLEAVDVRYYRLLNKELAMEDALQESSVMASLLSPQPVRVESDCSLSSLSSWESAESRKRSHKGDSKRNKRHRSA